MRRIRDFGRLKSVIPVRQPSGLHAAAFVLASLEFPVSGTEQFLNPEV